MSEELATTSGLGVSLTADEWGEFFHLLAAVAWADGEIRQSEAGRLRAVSRAYGVDGVVQVAHLLETEVDVPRFRFLCRAGRDRGARFAIREAVAMALADGEVSETERAVVGRACVELGVPSRFLVACEAWCREVVSVLRKGQVLLTSGVEQ